MGKSSSQTIGYWYDVAYHAGLGIGPMDAFLEFRGGDKTAWAGNLTASGTITINAPYLWGGEKDQGGIVGDVDVMFGEATQQPNAYLLSTFGSQVPAWRGVATLVFKGGKFGAMNPYPQKPAYKILRTQAGWDDPGCWYPTQCNIPILAGENMQVWTNFQNGFSTNAAGSFAIIDNGAIANTTANASNSDYWRAPLNTGDIGDVYFEFKLNTLDRGDPITLAVTDASGAHILDFNPRTEDVVDSLQRPAINYFGPLTPIYSGALSLGIVYSFEATIDRASGTYAYTLKQDTSVLASGVAPLQSTGAAAYLTFARTSNVGTSSIAECTYARVTFGGGAAMNPAHILYYARTNQAMGREPTANMSDASFRAGADWYAAQSFGLCTEYDPSAESTDDFISRIEKVAGCSVSRSPIDGLWYLDIANGVYDLASLPILGDDDILDFAESPSLQDSATNSISVQYFDPEQKETINTAPVQAMALVDAFGTNHQQVSYPEVPTSGLALRLADRDLRAAVTPARTFQLTTTRLSYGWRVGTYFRLQSPKRGIADMVCILAEKSSGTLKSGAIKMTASQDIYSLASATFVDAETGVDTRPSQIPVAIALQAAFEAPYIEVCSNLSRADLAALPSDVGYLMAVAADPATSRDFTLSVSSGGAYAPTANGDWCATATVVQATQAYIDTAFTLAGGVGLSNVTPGMPALWGSEIVRVDSIDPATGAVTFGRACGDTVPAQHAAGERVWFYAVAAAADTTEYTDSEVVQIKLLTNTGSQQLDPSLASALSVTFGGRAARPYAPGNLKINGVSYPSFATGVLALTWSHRDRVQQADQLIDTTQTDIGPETGVTYTVRVYLGGVLQSTSTGITANTFTPASPSDGTVRVEVAAVRDGLESWQAINATFDYTSAASPRVTTSGELRITTAGDARATE